MSTELEAAFRIVTSHMRFYQTAQSDISRIQMLVQDNPEFFEARPGYSCLRAAADTLERLVKERKAAR